MKNQLTVPLSDIAPANNEREYRRGYCDGFISAIMAMPENKLRSLLFDFWQHDLIDWKLQEPQNKILIAPYLNINIGGGQ